MMVRVGLAAGENKNAGARAGKTIKMGVRKDCSKNGVICLQIATLTENFAPCRIYVR